MGWRRDTLCANKTPFLNPWVIIIDYFPLANNVFTGIMPYTVAYKIGLSCDYDGTFQLSSKKIV